MKILDGLIVLGFDTGEIKVYDKLTLSELSTQQASITYLNFLVP